MNKEARLLCLWLVVSAGLSGCAHKPSYSEMDANRASRNQNQNQSQNQNSEGQTPESTPPPTQTPAADGASSAPATPATSLKPPSFLDQSKGEIKDLPPYPNAFKMSVQIGPIQGVNTMSLALTSTDPMDKIAAFFERVIKDHKWTVVSKLIDPEFSEWTLKKGEANDAKVQVKKDPAKNNLTIVLVRSEKPDAPSK